MTFPALAAESATAGVGLTGLERLIADHTTMPAAAGKADGRHARGQRRQRALVDAARELFIQQGYRGTTLEAIIERAGGSRETIYRVFGGKRGLFGAIITESGERLAASAVAPNSLGLAPREGLTRFAADLIEVWWSDEGRAMNRVVVSEGLDAPDLVEAWYRGGTAPTVKALSLYLDAQSAAGRLSVLDPQLVARQFITLLMGEVAFPLIAPDVAPPDASTQIARCVDLILRAYAPA